MLAILLVRGMCGGVNVRVAGEPGQGGMMSFYRLRGDGETPSIGGAKIGFQYPAIHAERGQYQRRPQAENRKSGNSQRAGYANPP